MYRDGGGGGGNCNTLNSSNQKQARVMTLNLNMLSRILCLPLKDEHDHFTSAEVFNKIQSFKYESYFWMHIIFLLFYKV